LSTEIHALVEGLGALARFSLTAGQAGDSPQALLLLLQPNSLSADKAYDTDALLDHLAAHNIEAVIPPSWPTTTPADHTRPWATSRQLPASLGTTYCNSTPSD
jgi:transposase